MNEIVVGTNADDIVRISSREVAEMMEMEHKNLLKKIDGVNEDFGSLKVSHEKYWIETTFKNRGKDYRGYLISKDGCEFLSYKINFAKGTLFTHRYMQKFKEMEEQLKNQVPPISEKEQMEVSNVHNGIVEIKVINKTEILGHEIQVISGGFGEDKKCLTDKQIAGIHDMEVKHVRESINRNIKRFKIGVDIVDLKVVDIIDHNMDILKTLEYSNMQISKAKNIYLLSERGYAKLIKIMDSDKAWEIHDKLIEEYFTMREVINSEEQIKAMALLKAIEGDTTQDRLKGLNTYTEIKVKEETAPLLATIEEQRPDIET